MCIRDSCLCAELIGHWRRPPVVVGASSGYRANFMIHHVLREGSDVDPCACGSSCIAGAWPFTCACMRIGPSKCVLTSKWRNISMEVESDSHSGACWRRYHLSVSAATELTAALASLYTQCTTAWQWTYDNSLRQKSNRFRKCLHCYKHKISFPHTYELSITTKFTVTDSDWCSVLAESKATVTQK